MPPSTSRCSTTTTSAPPTERRHGRPLQRLRLAVPKPAAAPPRRPRLPPAQEVSGVAAVTLDPGDTGGHPSCWDPTGVDRLRRRQVPGRGRGRPGRHRGLRRRPRALHHRGVLIATHARRHSVGKQAARLRQPKAKTSAGGPRPQRPRSPARSTPPATCCRAHHRAGSLSRRRQVYVAVATTCRDLHRQRTQRPGRAGWRRCSGPRCSVRRPARGDSPMPRRGTRPSPGRSDGAASHLHYASTRSRWWCPSRQHGCCT